MTETKDIQLGMKAVDTSNISAWDPQRFSDMVDTAARANYVMRGLAAEVNTQLVGSAGSAVDIRNRGTVSATDTSENTQISTADVSHGSTTVDITDKPAVRTVLTSEAEEDALDSQEDGIATEHGEAIAKYEDQNLYDLVADDTLGSVQTVTASTDGEISYTDIVDLRAALQNQDRDPDALVVSPDHHADLLKDDKFTRASELGDDVVQNGMVGRIAGVDVFMTTQANATSSGTGDVQAVMLDTSAAFAEAIKRNPTTELDREPDYDRWQIVTTMRLGYAILNQDAIGQIRNA